MKKIKEEFLQQYENNVLSTIKLPDVITYQYKLVACLKYTEEKRTYLISSVADGGQYVLKQTVRSSKEALLDEYVMLSFLDHPSLPHVLGYMEDGDYCYLIREFIPGVSLYDSVERNGAYSENETLKAAIEICRGLGYLHSQNPPVINRDVKPHNIIVTPLNDYKIIDMGTSRRYKRTSSQDTVFMGTQITAAPEQFGYGQTDARSDIYAMGVLMVYLLTGRFDIGEKALAGVSRRLKKIIRKCLEFDPVKRYANANVLKSRLELCLHGPAIRRKILIPACAFIFLLTVGFGLYRYLSQPDPSQVVKFQSPLIEQAVRSELGRNTGDPIIRSDLDAVTQVLVCGNQVFGDWNRHRQYSMEHSIDGEVVSGKGTISSLEDLRLLKNLNTLILDNQNISDISPLRGLPLTKVSLCGNHIADLSPLKGCKTLSCLRLEDNPIADIQLLAGMEKLEVLDIGNSNVAGISSIRNLPIRELYMIETKVEDFSPLENLSSLNTFVVRYLPPKGIDIVGKITGLKSLTIYNSGIESLDAFSKLTDLEQFDLTANNLHALTGVEVFQNLSYLGVNSNPISDISPAAALPRLSDMGIEGLNVQDYSVLTSFPKLKTLYCTQKQKDAILKTGGEILFNMVTRN